MIKALLKLISAQVRTNICSCKGSYATGKENKFYQETSAPLGTWKDFIKSTLIRTILPSHKKQPLLEWSTESICLSSREFHIAVEQGWKTTSSARMARVIQEQGLPEIHLRYFQEPLGLTSSLPIKRSETVVLTRQANYLIDEADALVATEVSWADWTLMLPGDLLSSSTRQDGNNTASLLIVRKIQTPGTTKQEQAGTPGTVLLHLISF